MNLFIDTPQRASERLERERQLAMEADGGAAAAAAAERPPASVEREPAEPYSVAEEAYRKEKAYDRKRARRRKAAGVLRVMATVVVLPVAVVAVFLVSYGLTCILNGASPDELAQLFGELFARVEGFAQDVMAAL